MVEKCSSGKRYGLIRMFLLVSSVCAMPSMSGGHGKALEVFPEQLVTSQGSDCNFLEFWLTSKEVFIVCVCVWRGVPIGTSLCSLGYFCVRPEG